MLFLSTAIMLLIFSLIGFTVQSVLQESFSFSRSIMLGFLSLLAIFHILAYPLIRLNASFSLLFWCYSILLFGLILLSCITIHKRKTQLNLLPVKHIFLSMLKELPLLLIMLGIVSLFLIVSCSYSYATSDDSYYLPRIMEILAQNKLNIPQGFSWSGIPQTSFPESADASTLECWKAYWSHLFGLHPTVFCRNTLTYVIHMTSMCTLAQAYFAVSRHKKDPATIFAFFITYFLFLLPYVPGVNSTSFWTIRFPAQGKSIFLSVIYPALICGCANIIHCGKDKISWNKWVPVSITLTAGIASTIVGVYLPFLFCLTTALPYLLIERRKDLLKLLPPLFLTCLPVVVYAGITLGSVVTVNTRYFTLSIPTWYDSFKYALDVKQLDIFLLCLLFILGFGSKTAKLTLAGGTIALALTFANPMFTNLVAKYITTGSVYFRIFWLFPVYFVIAYAVAEIYGQCKQMPRRILSFCLAALLLFTAGFYATKIGPMNVYHKVNGTLNLTLNGQRRTNNYGLHSDVYDLGEQLLANTSETEHIRVMWLSDTDCYLRQYSERIELLGACRPQQWIYYDQPLESADISPFDLRNLFFEDDLFDFQDPTWCHEQLLASDIDYICVETDSGFAKRNSVPQGFVPYAQAGSIQVYKIISK